MAYRLLTDDSVQVFVDGYSPYAIVVWLAEDTDENACEGYVKNPMPFSQKVYVDPLPCNSSSATTSGVISADAWGGDKDVRYRIVQMATPPCECDPYKEKAFCPSIIPTSSSGDGGRVDFKFTTSHSYEIISSITIPYYLDAEDTVATLSVTYSDSFVNECDEIRTFTSVTTANVYTSVADCDNNGIVSGNTDVDTLDGAYTFKNVEYKFFHTKPSDCDCNTEEPIIEYGRATYVPNVVPYSGGTVRVTKQYVEINIKDCIETRENKVTSYTINVGENTTCDIIYDVNGEVGLRQLYNENNPNCEKCSDRHEVWYDIEVLKVTDARTRIAEDEDGNPILIPIECCDESESGSGRDRCYRHELIYGNDVSCDCDSCPIITPSDASGSGGRKRFDLLRGGSQEGGGTIRPPHMMPYYGGIAYAVLKMTAYTLNEDCEVVCRTIDYMDIPIEVDSISREDCNPDGYMCNSYEVVYGPDHDGVTNRVVVCVAQSTDCERDDRDCDSDDFALNPTTLTVNCYGSTNTLMSTFSSACIRPNDVSATTSTNWIHLRGVSSNGQLNGYNIYADIDENASVSNDRSGSITVKHNYLGLIYTSTINVTQLKCNLECNCGSLMDDVPTSDGGATFISAHTSPLPYSGNSSETALWVYHSQNGCTPTYCITPSSIVYGDSVRAYDTRFSAVYGKINDNEDPNNERVIHFGLSFTDNCNDVCSDNGISEGTDIVQSRFVCDCAKLNQGNSSMRSDIPSSGSPSTKIKIGEVSTYKGSNGAICAANSKIICEQLSTETQFVTSISVDTTSNGTSSGNFTNVNVMAKVAANNTVNDRNFTIVVYITSGSASEKIECFRLTGKQKAIECACSDVTYTDVGQTSYDEGQHTFTAFTYSFASGKSACEAKMGNPTSSSNFVTVSKSNGNIVCNMAANNTTQERSATISISMGGECTHTFTVTQDGRCPTYTINPNNGSGSSGNKTFTLTSQ